MKQFLLFVWQLPQNLLGLLVIFFTGASKSKDGDFWVTAKGCFGVSLGSFIIFGSFYDRRDIDERSIKHEQGHQKQSLYLGWLYLFVIGVPSICRNLWDRIAHTNWSHWKREQWYYNGFPEKQADKLGGVIR